MILCESSANSSRLPERLVTLLRCVCLHVRTCIDESGTTGVLEEDDPLAARFGTVADVQAVGYSVGDNPGGKLLRGTVVFGASGRVGLARIPSAGYRRTMSRWLKRSALGALIAGVLLVAGLVLAPVIFKDRILGEAKRQAAARINATIDFEDADLSLFSTFPVAELSVDRLTVDGVGVFEGERLAAVDRVAVGVDVWALVMTGHVLVNSLALERPVVRLRVDEAGRANYDIAKSSTTASSAEADSGGDVTEFRLERYEIKDGSILYETPSLRIQAEAVSHAGAASIVGSTQTLHSETEVGTLSVVSQETAWVDEAKAKLTLDATVQSDAGRLKLRQAQVEVNELAVATTGTVAWAPAVRLDLAVRSNDDASIKSLLSTLPPAYTQDLKRMSADGTFALRGQINGGFAEGGELPPFSLALSVDHGQFKYPDRTLAVRGVEIDASMTHPGGPLDKAKLRVAKLEAQAGRSKIAGRLTATRLQSEPFVDLKVNGKVDLDEIDKAVPVPEGLDLSGRVTVDADMAASAKRIDRLTGQLAAENVLAAGLGGPPIEVQSAKVQLTDKATRIDALQIAGKQSDLNVTGSMSPLSSMLLSDAPMTGTFTVKSKTLVISDFVESTPEKDENEEAKTGRLVLPGNLTADVDLDVGVVDYGAVKLRNLKGKATLKDRTLDLKDVRAKGLGGDMKIAGRLATSQGAPPRFEFTYGLSNAAFAEAYKSIGAVQELAPIAKHLTGRFGTSFSLKGALGDNMALVTESLDLDGFVETKNTSLSGFKPLTALSRVVPKVRSPVSLKNLRANFAVKDGSVYVKEFPINVAGLKMAVGGRHGLDQAMRYTLKFKAPARDLASSAVGDRLRALKIGADAVTKVDVQANVTGTVGNPKVSLDLSPLKQLFSAGAKKLIDEAKAKAAQLLDQARIASDKAKRTGFAQADAIESKAKNPIQRLLAKKTADGVRQTTNRAAQKILDEAQAQADQLIKDAQKKAANLSD